MGSPSKQPAARLGDIDTGHPPAPPTPIITASANVLINGIPAARKGDMLAPHHPGVRIITEGSGSVNINGMPAARITDAINCGGTITIGSGNVFIGDNPPSGSALAPGEWQDYIDSSIAAGAQSPIQAQQMRADKAVKYRGSVAGSDSWQEYYSNIDPKQRPTPASVQNSIERTGLEQANNAQPVPAPTVPNPAQQQVIDNAGQEMQKAIVNLVEGEMVTPEMLNLASTMLQAVARSNKNNPSTGSNVPNKAPKPTQQDIDLAKSNGSTPQQITAREKVARNYLENNGFTEGQILSAIGSSNGLIKGGIDMAKSVKIVQFPPPDTMTQYVKSHGNPGNWFDPLGNQTPDSLGINGATRQSKEFQMPKGNGLLSYSKPIVDNWTVKDKPVQTRGGGVQLLVNDVVKKSSTGV